MNMNRNIKTIEDELKNCVDLGSAVSRVNVYWVLFDRNYQ
jgi:hypothetical protein